MTSARWKPRSLNRGTQTKPSGFHISKSLFFLPPLFPHAPSRRLPLLSRVLSTSLFIARSMYVAAAATTAPHFYLLVWNNVFSNGREIIREGKEGGGWVGEKKAKVDKNWTAGFQSSHACRPRNISSRDRCVNGLTTGRENTVWREIIFPSRDLWSLAFFPRPWKRLRFDAWWRIDGQLLKSIVCTIRCNNWQLVRRKKKRKGRNEEERTRRVTRSRFRGINN